MEEYQKLSSGTFKPAEAIEDEKIIHLLDWCLGLSGETGEVLDLIKHKVFHKEKADLMELAKELGDVMWYVSAICTTCEISLDDVQKLNILKLQHRYNKGYSTKDSAARHGKEQELKDLPAYKILQARITQQSAPVNVIVIGPDGAGKTTLISRLATYLNMPVHKCDYRTEDKVAMAKEYLENDIDVIYDRFFFPDDQVYSELKQVANADYGEVFSLIQKRNVVIIYVSAPLEVLTERSKAWADDYVKVSELTKLKEIYGSWLDYLDDLFPVLRINNVAPLDSSEYDEQIECIGRFINKCRDIYKYYPTYEDYLNCKIEEEKEDE